MVKRTLSALLSAVLAFSLLLTGASAAEAPAWSVQSATWQDPNNVMLIWEAEDGYTYNIYRSASAGGEYELIGTAEGGSFRDAEAEWPTAMYYTVEGVAADGTAGARSEPIRAGANGQKLSKVSVVMYNRYTYRADEAQGVEFEEYSLRPADFAADLAWLRENGYTTITSDDVIDYINGLKPLPPKAVIISIDDGTEGVYKNGWPLLREYRAKADFNLIGENIDSAWELVHEAARAWARARHTASWEELTEMERSGEINLCSHTYGLHRFNNDGRTGASMKEGETAEEYAAVVKADYDLCVSCIGGWTGAAPHDHGLSLFPPQQRERRAAAGQHGLSDTDGRRQRPRHRRQLLRGRRGRRQPAAHHVPPLPHGGHAHLRIPGRRRRGRRGQRRQRRGGHALADGGGVRGDRPLVQPL